MSPELGFTQGTIMEMDWKSDPTMMTIQVRRLLLQHEHGWCIAPPARSCALHWSHPCRRIFSQKWIAPQTVESVRYPRDSRLEHTLWVGIRSDVYINCLPMPVPKFICCSCAALWALSSCVLDRRLSASVPDSGEDGLPLVGSQAALLLGIRA